MSGRWALTGRAAHLARVGEAFTEGALGGVLVTGPAGVGKTRLGEEVLLAAGDVPTARAVGHEATRAIPLGALAHLLPTDLVLDVGVGDDDRARLFHLARLHLVERAGDDRLLLLLDDVDQLDDTSLALLLPLTVDRVVFVVATLRDGRPMPAVVAALVKDGHLEIHDLPALDGDEVATLLHRVLDGPIDAASVDRLGVASEGNLQVLQEVVRSAQDRGALTRHEGVWHLTGLPLSARLEDLVTSRLDEVDGEARHVLELLAVAGTVGVADLEAVVAARELEALEEHGFIEVTIDRRRIRASLAHPLYGEVLRERLSPLRARRLQQQLADRLEAHGARRREDVLQLAQWRLEAGGEVDVDVLLGAGRLALAGQDTGLAQRFATEAAERGARHDAARIAVEAAVIRADFDGVERAVAQVWDDPTLPDAHRAHLCRRLVSARFPRFDVHGALAAVETTVPLLTDRDALDLVLAQRAVLLAACGRARETLAVLAEIAPTDEPRLASELASARSIAEVMVGRYDDGLASARAGLQAERDLPPWIRGTGTVRQVVNEAGALAYGGRFAEARAVLDAAAVAALAAGAPAARVWLELVLGHVAREEGDGRESVAHYEAATELAAATGQPSALVWGRLGAAQGHLLVGEVEAAATALRAADEAGESPLANARALRPRTQAWLAAARGDLAGARALAAEAAATLRADGWTTVEVWLLHDLVRFGAPEAVADRLAELATTVEGRYVRAVAARARAAADGDRPTYAAVIDAYEAAGHLAWAAEAAAETAELHRRAGDLRAAAAVERRLAGLVERTGVRTPVLRRGRGVEPLTAREREVALLAASGSASKAIAAELFLSVRTVDTHLARIYRKLGVAGREELAGALEQTGP